MKSIRTSSLPRLVLCPGSFAAAQGLESKSSPEAESGDRIHLALEAHYLGVEFDEARLSDRESMVFRWFRKEADALIEKHEGAKRTIPELELKNVIPDTDILLTGHIDLVVECNDGVVLILDWKSGFLEVPAAKENLQLTGYVWNFYTEAKKPDNEFDAETIHSYLFSSGSENAFTGAGFSEDHIRQSGKYLKNVALSCMAEGAARIPGEEQCKYCPAKCTDHCPESSEHVEQAAIGMELMKTEEPQLPADKSAVVRIFKAIKQVESFGRKFNSMLKAEVEANPEAWDGMFELKEGNKVRSITDVQGVYAKVVDAAELVKPEDFLAVVNLSIGDLEKLLKEPLKEDGILVKDQKSYIAELLGGMIEEKQNSPSVKVVA